MQTFLFRWAIMMSLVASLLTALPVPKVNGQGDGNTVYLPVVLNQRPTTPVYQGEGTYYTFANGDGACMFGPSPNDLMVAALNAPQYGQADYCGAYVEVTGPKGKVIVRIVDLCPECAHGDLDFSTQAFDQIADRHLGRVPISWRLISPDLSGPISYNFKSGSNWWWIGVQIRNHRNPIAKLEFRNRQGQWIAIDRQPHNYFQQQLDGEYHTHSFRVTDIYGNVITDYNIPMVENGTIPGSAQFPYGP